MDCLILYYYRDLENMSIEVLSYIHLSSPSGNETDLTRLRSLPTTDLQPVFNKKLYKLLKKLRIWWRRRESNPGNLDDKRLLMMIKNDLRLWNNELF